MPGCCGRRTTGRGRRRCSAGPDRPAAAAAPVLGSGTRRAPPPRGRGRQREKARRGSASLCWVTGTGCVLHDVPSCGLLPTLTVDLRPRLVDRVQPLIRSRQGGCLGLGHVWRVPSLDVALTHILGPVLVGLPQCVERCPVNSHHSHPRCSAVLRRIAASWSDKPNRSRWISRLLARSPSACRSVAAFQSASISTTSIRVMPFTPLAKCS